MVKQKLDFIKNQEYKNVVLNYIIMSLFVVCFCCSIIYFIYEGILYFDYKDFKDTIDNTILEGKSELTIYKFEELLVSNEIKTITDDQRKNIYAFHNPTFYQSSSNAPIIDEKNVRYSVTEDGAFFIWSFEKTDPSKDEYEYAEVTASAIGFTQSTIYREPTPSDIYRGALNYLLENDFHNTRKGNGYPLTEVRPKSVAASFEDMFYKSKYYILGTRMVNSESGQWGCGQEGIQRYGNDYYTVYMDFSSRFLTICRIDHKLEDYRTITLYTLIPLLMVLMVVLFVIKKKRIQYIDFYWKKWYSEDSDLAIIFRYNILTKNSMMLITPETEITGSICLSNSNLMKFQNSLCQTFIYEIIEIDKTRLVLKDTSNDTITNFESV